MRETFDIVISGAGPAGLIAAARFGAAGFRVLIVDPRPPVTDAAAAGADLRTTAFLAPAQRLLQATGVWQAIAPGATPLEIMRIVDAAADPPVIRDFAASDIGAPAFGWNVRNWALRAALLSCLDGMPSVTLAMGTGYLRHLARTDVTFVTLTDARQIATRLLIGADGRQSAVRSGAGIGHDVWRYGQKALSFSVTHAKPHQNISTEVHCSGGPYTLVPLPDHDGKPCSAVVWLADGPAIARLASLEETAFERAASERSAGVLGGLRLVTRRQIWPITTLRARALTAERTALIAEAAHAVPPIGAQGLNMSLADIALLADLAVAAPGDLGGPAMLDRYAAIRRRDLSLRLVGIDMLNRASQSGLPTAQALRALGLRALHDVAPVRHGLMQLGVGHTATGGTTG